jgi:dTMP kinase
MSDATRVLYSEEGWLVAAAHTSILIAVEGIDGAGKTTQVAMLRDALNRVGETLVVSKEPTSGQWGRVIRESASNGRLSPEVELDLFVKDRTEHVEMLIGPALEAGSIVILDRYFYSSIAYQGSRGANVAEVKEIMESRFPIPDAVFLLDIDPVVSVHRIAHSRQEEPNHFEDRENLARARAIFNEMEEPYIHAIDGAESARAVHARIIELFVDGALKKKRCSKTYGCDDPFHCAARITNTCEWLKVRRELLFPETAVAR